MFPQRITKLLSARAALVSAGTLLHFLFLSSAPSASQDPRTVGVLETRAPASGEFLLRGTLPLPPGVYPRPDGRNPFRVLDVDGTPLVTQTEIVSRYPAEEDGADVVELLARVHRDPTVAIGAPTRYSVVLEASEPLGPVDGVPEAVRELVTDPTSIGIRATDCFGNVYVARPLDGRGTSALLQRGPVRGELRIYQEMVPVRPVAGSTLPHLLGVHAYVSFARGSNVVGLDLRFHNAHDGHGSTSIDDPLGTLYFRKLEVSVPAHWRVFQDFDDPLSGAERFANGRRFFSLVEPMPQGKMHVIRWQGQFHRRLALAPDLPADVFAARQQLAGEGRAFCVRGFMPGGREYWSWWNAATARYFPQRHRLPLLDHVPRSRLAAEIEGDLQTIVTHLASGQDMGDYPIPAPRLGWGHPWGVDYGGMTGGLEIYCYDGITAAALASPSAFRLYSGLHRMQTDRMPNALYSRTGMPSSVEQWRIADGSGGYYVPFEHYNRPQLGGSRPDPFGVTSAPRFQIDFVAANGLNPGYESRHFNFDPYDFEHFIRYTRSAKVLAWLANDSLAKDDLRMQAENFHLSFHGHPNNPYGGAQSSGLLSLRRYVATYPGQGSSFGRGQAWGLDCAVAAYSLGTPAWRAAKRPWFREQIQVLLQSQPACNGFLQAIVSSKAVDGRYRARQAIEQSITENALVGLHESVFRGADMPHAVMTRDVLQASLRAFISEMSWFPGQPGPWRYTGVGPISPDLPQWCSRADMPGDAWSPGDIESYQDWSSLAYGYELTGDPLFLRHARFQIGGANFDDLHQRLESQGTENIENRAALLTVVQEVAGEL